MMRKIIFALFIALGIVSTGMTTVVKAADTNKFGITIDGNFNDWKDKPKVDFKNPWDTDPVKEASLLTDGDYIYYYVTMSKTGKANYPMQVNDYELTVGGKTHVIYIKNASNLPENANRKVMLQDTTKGDYNMIHSPAIVHTFAKDGNLYASMECKIPAADLHATSIDLHDISMKNPILGNKVVEAKGASTGPIVLASIGFGIALLSFFTVPKLKKMTNK
ncbi:Firmicu-CTERM sorting domain-containing protein [Companilactobacillus muriivasis]|uniref:Firmicu-CTERM sorting domain-containing protein n=1 Tax=Companilactobacillus muriivasis TaxID=3081444 RepID=UPI0030C6967A